MKYKKFGDMTREEQAELVYQVIIERKTISFSNNGEGWREIAFPAWDSQHYYRVASTKPSIDWDHVHSDLNWLARDESGSAYLYDVEPVKGKYTFAPKPKMMDARPFASYKPGDCNWSESLVRRPKS